MADDDGQSVAGTVVYCDGAARGNPGPAGWGAVVLIGDARVFELGGAAARATNNAMELTAAARALDAVADQPGSVEIRTDSTYLIHGATEWYPSWKRRGWRTSSGEEPANLDLWHDIVASAHRRGPGGLVWKHVRGHAGIAGNERADAIATAFADNDAPSLYDGAAADYAIDVAVLRAGSAAGMSAGGPSSGTRAATRPRPRARGKGAYSYLSVVGGVLERHATWAECERRVRGVSGARYRKAANEAEESEILRGWGMRG